MSVEFKKAENFGGHLETRSNYSMDSSEYVERMRSLIEVLQHQDKELMNQESFYNVLEVLADMLPTPEQARKMFNCEH